MYHGQSIPTTFLIPVYNDSISLHIRATGQQAYPQDIQKVLSDLRAVRLLINEQGTEIPWLDHDAFYYGSVRLNIHVEPFVAQLSLEQLRSQVLNVANTLCLLMRSYGPQDIVLADVLYSGGRQMAALELKLLLAA